MTGTDFDLAALDSLDALLAPDSPHELPATVAPAPPAPAPAAETAAFDTALAEVRKNTRTDAAKVLHSAVQVLGAAFDAGEADFDDALKAVPVLSKVVEHFEKLEADEKGKNRGDVIFHFTFDMHGGISAQELPAAEVVDGQVSEVGEDEAERDTQAPEAYEIDLAPLLGEGGAK